MYLNRYKYFLISLIFILVNFSINPLVKNNINSGYLNLGKIDLNKDWKITLNGEWEFYWNQLLTPDDFKNNNFYKINYLKVPSIWKNKSYDNSKLPAFGYGTYRIKIGPVIKDKILSIDIKRILTSYKIWVDNKLLFENGIVGVNKKESSPCFSRRIETFIPKNEELEIIIQVSNFYDARGGGIFRNINIGNFQKIQKDALINFTFDLFLIGALFFACAYHFIIYLFRKKEKILLVFSGFFILFVMRIFLTNSNFLLYMFPNLNWELELKIEVLTIFISTPFALSIIYFLFSDIVNFKVLRIYNIICLLYSILIICVPSPNFILVLIYFYPFVLLFSVSIIYWIIKTIYYKKDDSLLFGFAFFIFLITIVNDILFSLSIIQTPQLMPLGLLVFASIQTLIIARRFSESFYKQEELSNELLKSQERLEKNNILLEVKVKERTIDLENQIKEREKIEKEIIKNQKLEAIGLLAGGIAHDFNNYLSIIMGNISIMKLIKNKKQLELALKDIESASKSATLLTNQLLTFSRGGEPIKQTIDISSLVKDVVDFVVRGTSIIIEYKIQKDLWYCDVDKGQITQVMTNLIFNAKQAMNDKGRIIITLENISEGLELNHVKISGGFIKMQIHDNGIGISKDNINKIFDPFFTTKKNGKGLGLTTSFSIIKKHNGFIFVESEENKSTTFTILIPANINSNYKINTQIMNNELNKTTGKVLVLDDEEYVLEVSKRMLSLSGIEVITASDGYKAVNIYKDNFLKNEKFLFILLDLTIPGSINGLQVLQEILKINKDEICVVSSGYSNDPVMSNPKKYGFFDVLKKPYSIDDLNLIIRKIILMHNNK